MLDYRLPDSDDLTLLAAIRRLSPRSGVILMTAHGTPEVTKGALNLGAYQVMHKPFELHDLEPLLIEAFTSSRPHAFRVVVACYRAILSRRGNCEPKMRISRPAMAVAGCIHDT